MTQADVIEAAADVHAAKGDGNLESGMGEVSNADEDCAILPGVVAEADMRVVDIDTGAPARKECHDEDAYIRSQEGLPGDPRGVKDASMFDSDGPSKSQYRKCLCDISDVRSISRDDLCQFLRRAAIFSFDALCVVVLLFCPFVSFHCLASFLWSTKASYGIGIPLFIFVTVAPCIVPCVTCCCCCCERCKCDKRSFRGTPVTELCPVKYGISRRTPLITGCCGGFACIIVFALVAWYGGDGSTRLLKPDWSASDRVAVIGTGPSGLSAAWLLAKGGRDVVIFEANDYIGGHSRTWDENSNMNFDLGFIFNNVAKDAYVEFKLFANSFNHALVTTALNTSSYYKGQYWDNTHTSFSHIHDSKVEEDIDHFMNLVNSPESTIRYLMPLGIWTWLNGFSDEFLNGPLAAVMSVLFVTKMGMWKQSSQAVLNYFRRGEGFCHFRYDEDKVQRGSVGSQYMWKKVLADMQSTGRTSVHLLKRATSLEKEDDTWTIDFSDGTSYGGFKDVVLAMPASESQKLVPGRGLESFLVNQIHYSDTVVTLHKDRSASVMPMFKDMPKNVDYFISSEPAQMSGFIAKIFGYDNTDIILSVHGWEGVAPLPIDPAKVMWQTVWSHHGFTLWELYVARKLLPLFNDRGGIHYAGDWIFGVGHNDAIRSGVTAACAVGIPREIPSGPHSQLYKDLIHNMCPENR